MRRVKVSVQRWIPVAAFISLVGLGAGVARWWARPGRRALTPPVPASATTGAPASADALSLVAPLRPGADLGGFQVREIRGVEAGVMRVVCVKEKAVVSLIIGLGADEGATPPALAGRYAVFYSARRAPPEEGDRLARALAKVLEANAAAPVPAGMTAFRPEPPPGTAL